MPRRATMSRKCLTSCFKVFAFGNSLGIYEKNIEIKASGFDGGSDWGSYVDQSMVAPNR